MRKIWLLRGAKTTRYRLDRFKSKATLAAVEYVRDSFDRLLDSRIYKFISTLSCPDNQNDFTHKLCLTECDTT
jgi:hypothetical protein